MTDKSISMGVNEIVELDYLVKEISDSVVTFDKKPGNVSESYISKNKYVFDPKDTGTYKLDINGQTIEIQVTDIPDSAILQYKFEDDSDTTTATDSITGNTPYDGTINGASYNSNAKVDSFALDFDGTEDYVELPSNLGIFDNSTSYSISMWVYPDDVTSGEQRIFHPRGENDVGITLNKDGNNKIIYYTYDGTTRSVSSSSLTSGNWYHVGVVWDISNSEFTLYIDGSPVDTKSTKTPFSRSDTSSLSGRIDDNNAYFSGRIDEFILSDNSWTDQQMSETYNTQK
jgi:hypothetical protein